jgi:hypothetical protein
LTLQTRCDASLTFARDDLGVRQPSPGPVGEVEHGGPVERGPLGTGIRHQLEVEQHQPVVVERDHRPVEPLA